MERLVLTQVNAPPPKAVSNAVVSRAREGLAMTTLKVIEALSQSDKSWEDAA